MNFILLLIILVGGAFLFKKLNAGYNEPSSGGIFVTLLGRSFSLRQSVGLVYGIMGVILLFTIPGKFPALLFATGYFIFGYRFVASKQRNKIYPTILSAFFLLIGIVNVFEKIRYGDFGDILFFGSLILSNSFIIYVLWFSKEKEYVLAKEASQVGAVVGSLDNAEKPIVLGNKRPLSVSIITWVLVVSGAYSIIMNIIALSIPSSRDAMMEVMIQSSSIIPIPFRFLVTFIILIVISLSGLMMLKGRNSGRMLYLVSGIIFMVYGFVVNSSFDNMMGFALMAASAVAFLINLFFLFRPKANEYFKVV